MPIDPLMDYRPTPVRVQRLPRGTGLPALEFHRRHRLLVGALWISAAVLALQAPLGGYDIVHGAGHIMPLLFFALLASAPQLGSRVRSGLCAAGLLAAASVFVHASHGLTEAHFAFFVVVMCLTLYEDWLPFLLSIAFVLVHHGVMGMLDPSAVYSGVSLAGSPWKWAAIHAAFVTASGSAAVAVWRLNEELREEKEALVARLDILARQDQLTGLPNRRAWDGRFAEELKRAARSGKPLSLALLDLDNLKVVNDQHGHEEGDRLLRAAAAGWSGAVRETDFIARLGGDEFGVLLPDCDSAGAGEIVQRLRQTMPSPHRFSAGVAVWDRHEPPSALTARADTLLYAAKQERSRRPRDAPARRIDMGYAPPA